MLYCIIQDSAEDWATEAASMANVYRFCMFTIAAANAWSGAEGFLRPQKPLEMTPCLLTVQKGGKSTKPWYAIPPSLDAVIAQEREI